MQPLREYFAARHLYETAPYPVDDQPINGDKFDRFKALVSNPYWLNVARFYGGCFNKGEILTLVNELVELSKAPPYNLTSHSRSVALMLLGDWVFNQYQPAVKQIVTHIVEYPHFRTLLANAETAGPSLWANLPDRSGRTDFLEYLWARLELVIPIDEQRALANAIVKNSSPDERVVIWENLADNLGGPKWARLGAFLGLLQPDVFVSTKANTQPLSDELLQNFVALRHFNFLARSSDSERTKTMILSGAVVGNYRCNAPSTVLELLAAIMSPFQYQQALSGGDDVPLEIVIERRVAWNNSGVDQGPTQESELILTKAESDAMEAYRTFMGTPMNVLGSRLACWSDLVEALRRAWGDCAAIDRIAFIGAGVKSKDEAGSEQPFEATDDLVGTARHIRLKSGAPRWWVEKLMASNSAGESRRLLFLLLMWGTPRTLVQIADQLELSLNNLTEADWKILSRDFRASRWQDTDGGGYLTDKEVAALAHRGPRLITFVGLRMSERVRYAFAVTIAQMAPTCASPEVQFALQALLQTRSDMSRLRRDLERISDLYLNGASGYLRNDHESLSKTVAESIMINPEKFPLHLVALSDRALTYAAGKGTPKLLEVAQREGWFSD
ncbi:hypothetical protein [Rhizobium leguminosarum]|uniref:hypothetical protein n=1 Tax=Rhizobium leguminosarum TaxID=384 RepID=UPI001C91B7F1|nr:hypothetical protein [Rhizobium leguminosarum]MBY2937565.1 hypothetical protein [Rhizobium leguminosarum]